MTMFVLTNDLGASRLGVSATRRLGGAVVRSRAKRRVRELFRTGPDLGAVDLVVVPRPELVDARWHELQDEFRELLRRGLRGAGGRHGR
jgi:ribonuclease P protein component